MLRKTTFLFTFLLVILFPSFSEGKNIKPTLMVYGNSIEAFAAAIQASRSNVPTLWVMQTDSYTTEIGDRTVLINIDNQLDGGLWKELSLALIQNQKVDSNAVGFQCDVSSIEWKRSLANIIKAERNLTVLYNTSVTKANVLENQVEIQLSNKEKIKFRAVIDASADQDVKELVGSTSIVEKPGRISQLKDFDLSRQRTLVSFGKSAKGKLFGYSLVDILSRSKSNLFTLNSLVQVPLIDENLSLRVNLGQALGAVAGYCAFFKSNPDKIDVRKLQMELLTHKARLLPCVDINSADPNFDAIQKIYLTGIFNSKEVNDTLYFGVMDNVNVTDIQPILHQLYSRAQLWFLDFKSTSLTLGESISLIKMVGFKSDEIDKEIKGKWHTIFKFSQPFDLDRKITRYEFAVLLNTYADPFVKAVNQEGKILR